MKKEVVEYCSECENEVILHWDTEVDGFEVVCPYCGKKLMLCDECRHTVCEDGEPHDCDWCDKSQTCHRCRSEIEAKKKREQRDFERQLLQKKAHERYKLYWCMMHGVTIDEISRIADRWEDAIDSGENDYAPFRSYMEANGFFGSNIWPCRDEFVDCEYQDVLLMKSILDPADFEKYLELEGEEHPDALGDTIKVETPLGTIVAKDQNDPDYPGVSLFFVPKGGDREEAGGVMEFTLNYRQNEDSLAVTDAVQFRFYSKENPYGEPAHIFEIT